MRNISVFVLLAAGLALAAPKALVRVELAPGQDAGSLPAVPVMMEFDGYCLVAAGEPELARLSAASFAFSVLDAGFDANLYVYAMPRPGFDRSRLAAFGTVLTEDSRGVVLRTTEDGVSGLNRLPVELVRVPHEPLVLNQDGSGAPVPRPLPDSLVWTIVNRVSEDSVLAHIRGLVGFYTRYSTTDSCRHAVEWVRTKFTDYTCDSTALENYRSTYAPNVIGVKFGRVNPRPIYVICGHADNTSDYQPTRCPGSDDNASGTSAVIEACRVFADMDFDNTVYFIGFTGEEQGLYGSDSFTRRAQRRGDSIKAAMNFDMISYGRQNIDTVEVIGKTSNPACAWLVDAFIANSDTFSNLKTHRSMESNPVGNSDHYSFLRRGYPALMAIEHDFTPVYHEIGDTVGTLYYTRCGTNNVPMATDAIRAAVATIAKLAGAHPRVGIAEGDPRPRPARISRITPTIGRAPVRLEFLPRPGKGARLEVYDATGRNVLGSAISNLQSEIVLSLNPGIYLFRMTDRNVSSTAKAIITE